METFRNSPRNRTIVYNEGKPNDAEFFAISVLLFPFLALSDAWTLFYELVIGRLKFAHGHLKPICRCIT